MFIHFRDPQIVICSLEIKSVSFARDLLIPTSDIKPTQIAKWLTKVFSTAWINMHHCFFSHNLSVFPKEVMPFCYIQLYTVVMSQGLKIANNLLWIVSNVYNTWKWQCTHHPTSIFSLFLLVTQAFYLFLKVLLESSWMINPLPILYCVSPHSILCWVGMLEFTLNEFWINVSFHLLMP